MLKKLRHLAQKPFQKTNNLQVTFKSVANVVFNDGNHSTSCRAPNKTLHADIAATPIDESGPEKSAGQMNQ